MHTYKETCRANNDFVKLIKYNRLSTSLYSTIAFTISNTNKTLKSETVGYKKIDEITPLESKLESIKVAFADLPVEKKVLDILIDYTYIIKKRFIK